MRGFLLRVVEEGLLAVLGGGCHLQDADRQPQEMIDGAHPAGITAGQVIVDRDQVDPLPGQRIQIKGTGRHQGFAFARPHFSDLALVQHDPAHKLHVVRPLADRPFGSFSDGRKGFRQ